MEYGCIGEHLKHSFSKEIHNLLCDYDYIIKEIPSDELDGFMLEKNFKAINVTIPYKERVIPFLEEIDDAAKKIGAVNTIVNKDGRLYGYNTDFYGMSKLINKVGIDIENKKVLILGSGGTSKTARAVCEALGAGAIIKVSRTESDDGVTYEQAYQAHSDADVIINTTPVGMFPKNEGCPIDIDRFPLLSGVIDAVYNPLRTNLIRQAKKKGIKAEGGLYMLVAQAVRACEFFTGKNIPEEKCDEVYKKILFGKENIVLTGMPGSGKTTIGKLIVQKTGKKFVDTDNLIREKCGCEISEIFEKHGEEYFRDIESEVISEISKENSLVIATGGGAVLREKNVDALADNGKIVFIDADINTLISTNDRPLSNTPEKLLKLYDTRYCIYCERCDVKVNITRDACRNADRILDEFINILK